MKKQYITKAYINDLTDKEKATGVFGTPPKVIRKGEKYRKALSVTQKFIYEELWDLIGKAIHKGQVDNKGRVYVEVSYSYMAVACDISEGTARNILKGDGKYNQLFELGLLSIKKRKDRETSEYYVMAPVYEGVDKAFLTQDITTPSMIKDAEELSAKKNKKKNVSKRETENKQLEEERKTDTVEDTAHYDVIKREEINNTPDFDEPKQEKKMEQVPEPQEKPIAVKKYVEERSSQTGFYSIVLVEKLANGSLQETDLKKKFPKAQYSTILNYARENYEVKQVEIPIG
ncbi:hypothetical protein [Priestia megaterium]|uniref:hypothetical protein n=1 Tax=Priestia megaterium TaxID=1404 RepID=UPI003D27903B